MQRIRFVVAALMGTVLGGIVSAVGFALVRSTSIESAFLVAIASGVAYGLGAVFGCAISIVFAGHDRRGALPVACILCAHMVWSLLSAKSDFWGLFAASAILATGAIAGVVWAHLSIRAQ